MTTTRSHSYEPIPTSEGDEHIDSPASPPIPGKQPRGFAQSFRLNRFAFVCVLSVLLLAVRTYIQLSPSAIVPSESIDSATNPDTHPSPPFKEAESTKNMTGKRNIGYFTVRANYCWKGKSLNTSLLYSQELGHLWPKISTFPDTCRHSHVCDS